MEHEIRPEGMKQILHGVAVVHAHGADVGGQHLVVQPGQRAFGGQQAAAPTPDRDPPGQRIEQIAAELPVGPGDEDSHTRGRPQPAAPHPASTTGARARSGSHQDRLAAYHSTVSANPSSQEISGAQPSWVRSLEESSR